VATRKRRGGTTPVCVICGTRRSRPSTEICGACYQRDRRIRRRAEERERRDRMRRLYVHPDPMPWLPSPYPAVAVVAHPARARQVAELSDWVAPEAVIWDSRYQGCEHTHRRAWEWLRASGGNHVVVLEDDAVPCEGFRDQLNQVIAASPFAVTGLYLGQGRPPHWQPSILHTITTLEDDVCWLAADELLHAVGYVLRVDALMWLLKSSVSHGVPIDRQIGQIARRHGLSIGYCWPSLVDHRDEDPVIAVRADGQPRTERRVAWRHGTRERWDRTVARIPRPEEIGVQVVPA